MFHAWFYPLSCVLFQLWSTFHMISWTNLLTRATVLAACFLLFLVPRSRKMNILGIGRDKSLSFYWGTLGARVRDGEGPEGGQTTWWRGPGQAALGGGVGPSGTPSVSPLAYKSLPIPKP